MEPQSQFAIALDNPLSDIDCQVEGYSLPQIRSENFNITNDLISNIIV